MKKTIMLLLVLIFNGNCSFNTSSNYWDYNNENEIRLEVESLKVVENDIVIDENFNKFKKEVEIYSNNSDYPDISK